MYQKGSSPPLSTKGFNQIRPLGIDIGISAASAGSSYITLGETKVKCCVSAPRPSSKRIIRETAILSISVRHSRSDGEHQQDFDIKAVLTELFEGHILVRRYPHQLIQAWITVEENDGGLFAACVMALSLALTDAGIQMKDMVAATSVYGYRGIDGSLQMVLDLTSSEEEYYLRLHPGLSRLHLAYCPSLRKVAYLLCTGEDIRWETISSMSSLAETACEVIAAEMKSTTAEQVGWRNTDSNQMANIGAKCQEIEL
ncbi:PNPase/RNase PH domain containing protein [Babesia gibsoni]|uniref:PNPase/RNase PH domain containing protein n=1 Tax=Babesia gibsoni TaxID=33632 RepID=A0AAD8USD5_BABGI|nr:PNPase/RNase PH domain containing protein [Babesia gibsoni]